MSSARTFAAPSSVPLRTDSVVVVRATTGLEALLTAELTELGHAVTASSKRQVVVPAPDASILARPPRLADDLFVVAAQAPDPGTERQSLVKAAEKLRIDGAWRSPGRFAISASFVGRRNFSRFDVEDAVGRAVTRQGGGTYVSRRDGAVPPPDAAAWRVTLDGETMHAGLRPFAAPLHRRPWRTQTVLGSIHPPVAAAMVRLARIPEGATVLDPCCGSGTILLEAHAAGRAVTLRGSDLDPDAIAAARRNDLDGAVRWRRGDARRVAASAHEIDRIVTNPPWGVRRTAGDLTAFLTEWRRVITPDGVLVVLLDQTQQDTMTGHPDWSVTSITPVSVAGQHPRIIVARPRSRARRPR